jgi:osmotically-inducible protein OsmY
MHIPRLIAVCLAAAVLVTACNRQDADANARRAADEVRTAADVASGRIADGWLTTKIQAQYFADDDIKARYINVSSRDGVVTVQGRVDDENAKQQALQIATNTDGVRDVRDLLIVGPPPTREQVQASWIATQIQARYFADSDISGRDISVTAADGVVTLSGRVHSPVEREQAIAIAQDIDGVVRVEDRLMVEPQVPAGAVATSGTPSSPAIDDAQVTSSIQAKYFLDNALKSRRIEVETRQGVVTLRGEVGGDEERAQALLLARTTEGVERVEDALTVMESTPPAAAADDALSSQIQETLKGDAVLRNSMLTATAKDGVVLLEGTVPSASAKQRALTLARQTPGVVQVVDRITIRTR